MKRTLIGAAGTLLAAAAIAAIVLLYSTLSTTQSDVTRLQRQVAALQANSVTLGNEVNTLNSQSPAGDVAKLKAAMVKFEQCVPQMQNEITSLSITGSYYGTPTSPAVGFNGQVAGWPLSVSDGQQLSPECQTVFSNYPAP